MTKVKTPSDAVCRDAASHLSRRQFCQNTVAASALTATAMLWPMGQAMARSKTIGNAVITTYSDGTMSIPSNMLFDTDAHPEVKPLLEQSGMGQGTADRPLNITLVDIGDRRILFDAGSGPNFLPGLGELPSELEAADIALDSITDVVFTHAHPDHIWGVIDDFDDIAMTEARFYMPRQEWDFWDSEDALAAMPAGRESFAVGAKTRFDALRDQIELIDFNQEIIPGIEVVDSRGHTPGHAAFTVHTGDTPVMVVGDALTHEFISFQHPDVTNLSDMDGAQAIASRLRLLDRLAADQMMLIGYHLPAPGFGRVERQGQHYHYIQA